MEDAGDFDIDDILGNLDNRKPKKKASITPTRRTLQLLKEENKVFQIVEYWNAFAGQRKDLFGFIDIVALDVINKKTWGIQCTSTNNMNARVKKICNECKEFALAWLNTGNHIEVIGWSKKGPRGQTKVWQPSRKVITLDMFT